MTDITGSIRVEYGATFGTLSAGNFTSVIKPQFGSSQLFFFYLQRIYDNGLGQYVYYKLSRITTEPNSTQTNPNHSGLANLDVSRHEIVSVITDIV